MPDKSRYRFLLIPPFRLPEESRFNVSITGVPIDLPKEKRLMNSDFILPHLEDVEWDLHPGELATYGDWPVETREEFTYAAAARLPNIRVACESGKYNAIILLGGGEPGFAEAREIARSYGVVVTANAFSQLHLATMLGNKFTVLDVTGVHNMYYRDVIIGHQLQHRCASIRNIGFHLPRPDQEDLPQLGTERDKARAGEPTQAAKNAVEQAHLAILEDGAEVITLGCSGVFWLQPYIKKGLKELGWDVPVLEGYSASIELAKIMLNLDINASGVTYMSDSSGRLPLKVTM
jgi:Asp/Glu/hydantoin racemase